MINQCLSYWKTRTKREQHFLTSAAGVLFVFLIYICCYAPLQNAVDNADEAISSKQDLMAWMQEVRPLFSTRRLKRLPATPLLGIVQEQLNHGDFQSFPVQLNQVQNNEISIQFAQVPFNLFLHWFWKLSEQYQFDIKKLMVQKTGKEGVVQVSMVLMV